jgi:hypothetical protein
MKERAHFLALDSGAHSSVVVVIVRVRWRIQTVVQVDTVVEIAHPDNVVKLTDDIEFTVSHLISVFSVIMRVLSMLEY